MSVGYPFESSSFGFVGSNRSTFYDSSATENNRRSIAVSPTYLQVPSSPAPPSFQGPVPPTPEGQKATQEPDTPQPSHIVHVEPIDLEEQLEVQEELELPMLPETTARKLRRSLRLGSRNRTICHQDQGSLAQGLLAAPGFQSTRTCHSFGSTGSGYMASMSGSNTSIGSSRNSIDESIEKESEEMVNLRRQRSRERLRMTTNDEYDPESRSSWASYPQEHPEDMELIHEYNQLDKHSPTKHAATTLPRSDSGVMGSSSSSFPNLKIFLRKPKTALSALTLRPSRSMTHLGQGGPSSDTDSSSKCSIRTAPVGSQGMYTRDQGLSVHVNSQRQSVVDMLQSQSIPISPLSAVSAGLPVWNALDGEAKNSSRSRVSPR